MRKTVLHILLWTLPLLPACQRVSPDAGQDPKSRVRICSSVMEQAPTRAPYTLTTPTDANPLSVAVWASSNSHIYQDLGQSGSEGTVAKHVNATFLANSATLDGVIYPNTSDAEHPVYLSGFHPTGWTSSSVAGTDALFMFNGSQDVMYASEVSGYYGIILNPIFTFSHLLTWLRINIQAESADAVTAWGKLTAITLTKQNKGADNPRNRVTIDLTTDTKTFSSSVSSLSLYSTGTDTVFPASAYTLPLSRTEIAYVLCAPVAASNEIDTNEYTFTLSTEKRSDIVVPVDLKSAVDSYFAGDTAGKQFTVTLTFTLNSIAVATQITDWVIGGRGVGVLDE